jgi:hypothetical protein
MIPQHQISIGKGLTGYLQQGLGLILLVLSLWIAPSFAKTDAPVEFHTPVTISPSRAQQLEATQRLQAIADRMQTIRLCKNSNCRYQNLTTQVERVIDPQHADVSYVGFIDAIMDRPSTSLDRAHYQFQFQQGRWHVVGGEELTSGSSIVFQEDEYQFLNPSYGDVTVDKLTNLKRGLWTGYRDLYFKVMDHGQER